MCIELYGVKQQVPNFHRSHRRQFLEDHMTHRPSIVFQWFTRYTQIQETWNSVHAWSLSAYLCLFMLFGCLRSALWHTNFALIAEIQSAYLHKHHHLVEHIPQYMRCRPWLQLLSNMCNMCCHRLEIQGKLLCMEATEAHVFKKTRFSVSKDQLVFPKTNWCFHKI